MDKTTETTPIVNYAFNGADRGWDEAASEQFQRELGCMHALHHVASMKAVEWMKSILGKQSYTWTSYRRYHVWEQNDWRVYVNNDAGISLEVNSSIGSSAALEQWRDFFQTVNNGKMTTEQLENPGIYIGCRMPEGTKS